MALSGYKKCIKEFMSLYSMVKIKKISLLTLVLCLSMLFRPFTIPAFTAAPSCPCGLTSQFCGNMVIDGTETCDDGNVIDYDACRNDCSGAFCPASLSARVNARFQVLSGFDLIRRSCVESTHPACGGLCIDAATREIDITKTCGPDTTGMCSCISKVTCAMASINDCRDSKLCVDLTQMCEPDPPLPVGTVVSNVGAGNTTCKCVNCPAAPPVVCDNTLDPTMCNLGPCPIVGDMCQLIGAVCGCAPPLPTECLNPGNGLPNIEVRRFNPYLGAPDWQSLSLAGNTGLLPPHNTGAGILNELKAALQTAPNPDIARFNTATNKLRLFNNMITTGTNQKYYNIYFDNVRGLNLSGINFAGSSTYYDFYLLGNTSITGRIIPADFNCADLSGANFTHANFTALTGGGTSAYFRGAMLQSASFDGSRLSFANFSGIVNGSTTYRTNLNTTIFSGTQIGGANFNATGLTNASFNNVMLGTPVTPTVPTFIDACGIFNTNHVLLIPLMNLGACPI